MSSEIDERDDLPIPEDFSLPASNIEEIDRALFDLFDETLPLQIKIENQASKVPVVFSTGERFALTRRNSPIRDVNNAIILPIISIYRRSIDLSPGQGGYGTPIAPRDQEVYTVRKRLSKKDRNYQKLINRAGIKNQKNVSSGRNFSQSDIFPGNVAKPGTLATRRNGKNLSLVDGGVNTGLGNELTDNIFEVITSQYPTFMLVSYEVIFWTQYVQHMNQLLEVMMTRFSGQDTGFAIKSRGGHDYVAFVKSPLSTADNFQDFSTDERIIRYSFQVDIPGYLFATKHQGLPAPFRKYESAPQIEFGYKDINGDVFTSKKNPEDVVDQNKFILSEVEQSSKLKRGQGSENVVESIENPFTGEPGKKFSKIRIRNERAGESVASVRIAKDLQTTLDSPSSE